MNISNQQTILTNTLIDNGASLVGYGSISILNTDLSKKYPTSISLCLKYDRKIVNVLDKNEEAFNKHLSSLNPIMDKLVEIVTSYLKLWSYEFKIIPIAIHIKDNEQLRNLKCFSHKFAATRAGLGWIGKSSLLITPEYGPRVKLCTVLTNANFITAEPIVKNNCDKCMRCIKACPYNAIKDNNWHVGIKREKLFDAYICNTKRLEFIPAFGRKSACGDCIKACPKGS